MAQADISKKPRLPDWEVRGTFEFSGNGKLYSTVKSIVYVKAESANEAALHGVAVMGLNAKVKQVFQILEGEE